MTGPNFSNEDYCLISFELAGTQGTQGTPGEQGPRGFRGPGAVIFEYFFSTNTENSDPDLWYFKLNNPILANATNIYINNDSPGDGNTEEFMLAINNYGSYGYRGFVKIAVKVDSDYPGPAAIYEIVNVSNSNGYSTLTVVNTTINGNFSDNDRCLISFELAGPQGQSGIALGNTAIVDAIYGNDTTATVGGSPYLTVSAAIAAVSAGQTVWIMPGTYTLPSGITIPNGTSLRGMSLQTVTLQMNVTSSTTMITMGENCRVEDLTINLTCTGSTDNIVLKGIVFPGTSSQTSKLRTAVVSVRNSTMAYTLTSTVTGVEATGTGTLNPSTFSFNSVKGCTINVYSNGAGNKRGLLVSNTNQMSTRDVNIYIAQPTNTASIGSYVGVEAADPNNTGSAQLRATTVGCVFPSVGQLYTASDILQTNPTTISDPTYLASAGIQIGPGTDLVTKSAGGKGFSSYVYPTVVYYGLKGNVRSGSNNAYLWPGTQAIQSGVFPDPGTPVAYFRIQQPALLCGLSCSLNAVPAGTNVVTLLVRYTPVGGSLTDTPFTVTFTGTGATTATFYNASVRLNTGDRLHVFMTYTTNNPSGTANAAHDVTVQLDLF